MPRGPGRGRFGRLAGPAALTLLLATAIACEDSSRRGAGTTDGASPDREAELPLGPSALPPSAGMDDPRTGQAAAGGESSSESDEGTPAGDAEAARRVLADYYDAIAAGDYERAYALWGDGGKASGQTFLEFAAGYGATQRVRAELGEPGRIEGAAGSRYITIPVVVQATTREGRRQSFEGSYTLRRAVVDGATEAQRRWHISDAEMRQVR